MSIKLYTIALSLALILVLNINATNILDTFDIGHATELFEAELRSEPNDHTSKHCLCKGTACICCVDFNFTLIDLGGPGCVHMKYLSQDEGFAVNISYGKSLIHKASLKGANPPPVCLEVFSNFAQMCARFSDLAPTSDGLRGCLQLEPILFGDTQLEFPIGCFKSSSNGMEMEPPKKDEKPINEEQGATDTSETDDESTISTAEILQIVNQSAEQGIAFLTNLLGININNGNNTKTEIQQSTTESQVTQSTAANMRRSKYIHHPNKL